MAKGPALPPGKRPYVSQSDVPRHSLRDALKVPRVLNDQYARRPTKPLRVAEALGVAPTTGTFRSLTAAAVAFGLTEGTAWADEISITELGKRAVAPTREGDDLDAQREALLKPRIIGQFLRQYDNAKLPVAKIGANVLAEMGVPAEAAQRTFDLIRTEATQLGLLREINGQAFVDLQGTAEVRGGAPADPTEDPEVSPRTAAADDHTAPVPSSLRDKRRVFITHGSNQTILQQLKELLTFGDLEPVVAQERETSAKPVSERVLEDMRSCGAAIVHVGTEMHLLEKNGNEVRMLNANVLIEIGAALALYGHRFVLLVEKGVELPSNLQGLYQVRYEGEKLEYEATMKLLRALNDLKK